jgi:cAMP-dependent protein kinase regulator
MAESLTILLKQSLSKEKQTESSSAIIVALLYNAPRAATIIAEEDSVCFSLDRDCFNNIVKDSAIARREQFETFVNKVELLKDLDSYERGQLSDCLISKEFAPDSNIITEV